jgi:hypothetical protein
MRRRIATGSRVQHNTRGIVIAVDHHNARHSHTVRLVEKDKDAARAYQRQKPSAEHPVSPGIAMHLAEASWS